MMREIISPEYEADYLKEVYDITGELTAAEQLGAEPGYPEAWPAPPRRVGGGERDLGNIIPNLRRAGQTVINVLGFSRWESGQPQVGGEWVSGWGE